MHAMVLSRIGELLTFTEMPNPIPGARRVRVRVKS